MSAASLADVVAGLRPGSVVAVVGADLPAAAEGVAVVRASPEPDAPLEPLLDAALGRVPARPLGRFLIDVLVLGEAGGILERLRPFLHPGGIVAARAPLPELGAAEPAGEWLLHRPATPPEDVHFAKLYPQERRWLHELVRALPPGAVYVEVGAYKGGSTTIAALANPAVTVYAVDPWQDLTARGKRVWATYEEFARHTQFLPNVRPVRIDLDELERAPALLAQAAGRPTPPPIDVLFLDGDHSYEGLTADLALYAPYASGVLCGHDWSSAGVRRALAGYRAGAMARRVLDALPERVWRGRAARLLARGVRRPVGELWMLERAAG